MKIKILFRSIFSFILILFTFQGQSQTWREKLSFAESLYASGKLDSAELIGEQILRCPEFNNDNLDTNLALVLHKVGKYQFSRSHHSTAEKYWKKAIGILEINCKKNNVIYAKTLGYLALRYFNKMEIGMADSLFKESIWRLESFQGKDNLDLARMLNNYGVMLKFLERFTDAERVCKKSLLIRQKLCRPDDMDLAESYGNLSNVYRDLGHVAAADSLRMLSEMINIKNRDKGHPQFALTGMNSYAPENHWANGNYATAESLFVMMIDSMNHWANVDGLDGSIHTRMRFGQMLGEMNKFSRAESVFTEAIERDKYYNGVIKKQSIELWLALAKNYDAMEKFNDADSVLKCCYTAVQKFFNLESPIGAEICYEMSRHYRLSGELQHAIAYAYKAVTIQLYNIRVFSPSLSEYRILRYSSGLREMLDNYFTTYFDIKPSSPVLFSDAVSILLQSKGVVTEEVCRRNSVDNLKIDPEVRILNDSLNFIRRNLSNLYVQGPGTEGNLKYKRQIESLSANIENIESEIALRSFVDSTIKINENNITTRIIDQLPYGGALIEFCSFNYIKSYQNKYEKHYLACVITKQNGETIVDLGPASFIDNVIYKYKKHFQMISNLNRQVSSSEEIDYSTIVNQLYNLIWKPISSNLKNINFVFLAPDGDINLISFAGLIEGKNYLAEKYMIHYISAGRDLLKTILYPKRANSVLALGDPDYDATIEGRLKSNENLIASNTDKKNNFYIHQNTRSTCSLIHEIKAFSLPATRSEITNIAILNKQINRKVKIILGYEASEERLKKEISNYKIIHLATHGFFINGSCGYPNNEQRKIEKSADENPLLLSGLLLAGANLHGEGADDAGIEDGILTALEVSSLDLRGTELIVLSACETGLGKIEQGEGVYGLRRAFQLAGARTVVSSLWQIPDRETTTFMKILYSQNAKTYPELFQKTAIQRLNELRIRKQSTHPYSWAGFIATGDWEIK